MSLGGSTSRHCYVIGCKNGDYWLRKWRDCTCPTHGDLQDNCPCPPPFELFTFPTKRLDPDKRRRWIRILKRASTHSDYEYFEPCRSHRVCSDHFVDGRPTEQNPDPKLKLGHSLKRPVNGRYTKRLYKPDEIPILTDLPLTESGAFTAGQARTTSPLELPIKKEPLWDFACTVTGSTRSTPPSPVLESQVKKEPDIECPLNSQIRTTSPLPVLEVQDKEVQHFECHFNSQSGTTTPLPVLEFQVKEESNFECPLISQTRTKSPLSVLEFQAKEDPGFDRPLINQTRETSPLPVLESHVKKKPS